MNDRLRVFHLVGVTGVLLIGSVAVVNPCTCIVARGTSFLFESGTVFPSNTRGIPIAYGSPRLECSVTKLDEHQSTVPSRLSAVDFPRGYSWKQHDSSSEDRQWLVCADWEPGNRYRISLSNRSKEQRSVEVEIGTEPFVPSQCTISTYEDGIGDVETETLRGSCRVRFSAHRVGVEIAGGAIDRWRGALLYFTFVDRDVIWRPRDSVCSNVVPGQSWVGPARELLYWCCAGNGCGAYSVLSKGEHAVKMIAWLPGVGQVDASKEISLGCY